MGLRPVEVNGRTVGFVGVAPLDERRRTLDAGRDVRGIERKRPAELLHAFVEVAEQLIGLPQVIGRRLE